MDKSMIREAANKIRECVDFSWHNIGNSAKLEEARKLLDTILAELDKPGEGDPDAHLSDEAYLKAKQDRFAKGGLANIDPDKYMEEVRGTGKVLTEQWVNACIGALERALHPVVIHGATTDTEDVRHAITTLRYARDNGYLSAPAKAPAGMVEAGNAMKEAIGQIAYELEEGMPLTDDSLCITEAERTVSKWDAALKSTNTPERRPGECDYRKRECVNDGKTVNGVWVCNNHLSNTPEHGN